MAKKIKKEIKVDKNSKVLSMGDLLATVKPESFGVKRGDRVKGKITAIKNRAIYVDIGAKSDAVVDGVEFDFVKDYLSDLKVGDEIG